MKTKIFKLLFLFLFPVLLGGGCEKEKKIDESVEVTLFDSLQGIWNWSSTYDPKKGIIDNDFQSSIHLLSVNNDTTINYKTYKNGVLTKSGKVKITNADWGRKLMKPDILLHYNVTNENYIMFLSKDSLEMSENADDNPFYYYVKE